jgi:hypothetical protein
MQGFRKHVSTPDALQKELIRRIRYLSKTEESYEIEKGGLYFCNCLSCYFIFLVVYHSHNTV